MSRLYATKYGSRWFVSNNRVSGYTHVCGDGVTLPAAYLDYLREQVKHDKRVAANKAEEARIVELIKHKTEQIKAGIVPEEIADTEPRKKVGLFGKMVRYVIK